MALAGMLIKLINSPFYNLNRKIDSIEQAIQVLGCNALTNLITGLLAKKAFGEKGPSFIRFWDVSAKKALSLTVLASIFRYGNLGEAHSFGLFCDIGIPLLLQKFENYGLILKKANESKVEFFTAIEQHALNTDHAIIGSIVAKSWGLSSNISSAIRGHHDYSCFKDKKLPQQVLDLIAYSVIADRAIEKFAGLHSNNEWEKAGELAMTQLGISDLDLEEVLDTILDKFTIELGH